MGVGLPNGTRPFGLKLGHRTRYTLKAQKRQILKNLLEPNSTGAALMIMLQMQLVGGLMESLLWA
jgi:hypothetical protein